MPALASSGSRGQDAVKEVILTPEGYKKLKAGDRAPLDRQASRGRRAHQRRARVRRHRRELRVRRREERAGDARAPHRAARGAARAARVIDTKEIVDATSSRSASNVRLRDIDATRRRVHHRRLGRGQPGRAQALERVAGRQGDHRPQEGRDRRGHRPARRAQVQDHGHQGRLACAGEAGRSHVARNVARGDRGCPAPISPIEAPRMTLPKRFPDRRRDRSPSGGGGGARAGRGGRASAPARGARAGRRGHGQARLPRPRRPLAGASSSSAPRRRAAASTSPRRHRRRDGRAAPSRGAASPRSPSTSSSCSRRSRGRSRTPSTGSPTSSRATASATSTC